MGTRLRTLRVAAVVALREKERPTDKQKSFRSEKCTEAGEFCGVLCGLGRVALQLELKFVSDS